MGGGDLDAAGIATLIGCRCLPGEPKVSQLPDIRRVPSIEMFSSTFMERWRGLFLLGTGVVTASEIHETKAALLKEEEVVRKIDFAIIDFRDARALRLNADQVRELARIDCLLAKVNSRAVVAIIAPEDSVLGVARLWQALADCTNWSTAIFRSRKEACAWLRPITSRMERRTAPEREAGQSY
jgi:hypothetical protein